MACVQPAQTVRPYHGLEQTDGVGCFWQCRTRLHSTRSLDSKRRKSSKTTTSEPLSGYYQSIVPRISLIGCFLTTINRKLSKTTTNRLFPQIITDSCYLDPLLGARLVIPSWTRFENFISDDAIHPGTSASCQLPAVNCLLNVAHPDVRYTLLKRGSAATGQHIRLTRKFA